MPPGSIFKGYEDFVVQDLIIEPRVILYRRERWQTPDGQSLIAPLPADVIPGSHFGPDLICFILHQYHHQHVTQPLLLGTVGPTGHRHLGRPTQPHPHRGEGRLPPGEGPNCCRRPWRSRPMSQVDDTGARHQGHNGSCTQIGNDLFACFESTDSKSRLNFLEILRRPHTDYVINEIAVAYWRRQKLAGGGGGAASPRSVTSSRMPAAWHARLRELGITADAARADRQRGGVAGQPDRSWGLAGAGDPQRRGGAVRRLGAHRLLDSRGTALGAAGPLQRGTPGGHREGAGADLGAVPGPQRRIAWQPEPSRRPDSGSAVRRVVCAADRLSQRRRRAQGDDARSGRTCCGCWSGPRSPCTTTSAKVTCGTTSRSGRSAAARGVSRGVGAGHVREPEEDVSAAGRELLGLSPGPRAGRAVGSPAWRD